MDIAIILVCICRAAFGQGQSRETINRPIWLYAGNSGNQAWLVFGRATIRRAPSALRLPPSALRLPQSVSCCQHAAVRVSTRSARPCLACWASGRTTGCCVQGKDTMPVITPCAARRRAPSACCACQLSAGGRPRINPEREALPRMPSPRYAFRRAPSAFRLPPCALRLAPSAFRLPPSAFRLPQSVSCCQHAAVRVSTRSARPCLACWASGRTTVQCGRAPRRGARNRVDKSSKKTPREEGATNIQIIL